MCEDKLKKKVEALLPGLAVWLYNDERLISTSQVLVIEWSLDK